MKLLTYEEAGAELGVHPLHVRRIMKRYPKLIQPIVQGYNRIRLDQAQVKSVKAARQRDAVKARASAQRALRKGGAR